MISVKCQNCGGSVHFDEDNIPSFCSFCGAPLKETKEYIDKAIDLKIEKQMHQMDMELLKKEIHKERIKNLPESIQAIMKIIVWILVAAIIISIITLIWDLTH